MVKHRHHIVPKHMNGDNSPDNLTPPISIPLHAALHKDLWEHFGKREDYIAWKGLLGEYPDISGMRLGSKNPFFGKHHTKQSKEKIRISNVGKHEYLKGRLLSQKTKDKISQAHSKNWEVILPDGKLLHITNLFEFCKQNELRFCHLSRGSYRGYKAVKR